MYLLAFDVLCAKKGVDLRLCQNRPFLPNRNTVSCNLPGLSEVVENSVKNQYCTTVHRHVLQTCPSCGMTFAANPINFSFAMPELTQLFFGKLRSKMTLLSILSHLAQLLRGLMPNLVLNGGAGKRPQISP